MILFKKRPGADRKLGADRSGRGFGTKEPGSRGGLGQDGPSEGWVRVYAKVTPKVGDGFVCRGDRSPISRSGNPPPKPPGCGSRAWRLGTSQAPRFLGVGDRCFGREAPLCMPGHQRVPVAILEEIWSSADHWTRDQKSTACSGFVAWARLVSNQRPLACEAAGRSGTDRRGSGHPDPCGCLRTGAETGTRTRSGTQSP